MRRDANTLAFGIVAKAVIATDDFIAFNPAGTQRRAAVQAKITGNSDFSIHAKSNQAFVQ